MTAINENAINLVFHEKFYEVDDLNLMLEELLSLPFFNPIFEIHGRKISPRRKIFGMGDTDYEFSGTCVPGNEWSPAVLKMKRDIENLTKSSYNFALLNYFVDGECKISMHREKEEFIEKNCPIVTFCFGETRHMIFKRKNFPDVSVKLMNGSVLLLYHPTNQLYSQGIMEDPTVKGATITVTFKNIKALEMPSKKLKLDWLDKLVQSTCTMEPTFTKISPSAYVVIKEFQEKFFVDIRHYDEVKGRLVPTKKGVLLTASEWCEFVEKIHEFDFIYANRNMMTSNLMLLNLNEQLHLQQISMSDDFLVFLKFNYIKLWPFEVEQLLEKIPDINKTVLHCLWHEFFPRIFSKKNDESLLMPCDEDTMQSAFRIVLEAHVAPILRKLFKCQGCLASSNSQLNHECLNMSFRRQFETVPNILLYVDFYKLILELNEKRIFTNDFMFNIDINVLDTLMFSSDDDDEM